MTATRPALCRLSAILLTLTALLGAVPAGAKQHCPLPDPTTPGNARVLTPDNTREIASAGRHLAQITFSDKVRPVLGPDRNTPAHRMLRRLVAAGQAAGNIGDLYDNRDRCHSRLPPEAFPQLTPVLYGAAFRKQGLDYGLAGNMLFNAPVIGNSSTALTGGVLWRSQPRMALTTPDQPRRLFENYTYGQIHVYPEHRDHDPERGDLIPANTPYFIISQGSSGSDQPHLEALAMILAAFRPDTKAALREAGLIAPTVQMVYRRARKNVLSRAAYLSGAAHPSVFGAGDIALARMVGLANAIKPDEIPPMVRLKVVEESRATEGRDYFGEGLSETLFDTPSAIARIWRSRAGRRRMVVSANDTRDPNGRDLTFHWSVLRGDPDRVRITPLTPDGRYARIVIDWQDPRPVPGAPDLLSNRVDIGVFANNGVYDSAPGFISVLLPRHERRVYEPGSDGAPRVVSIDRHRPAGVYADPILFPDTDWRDVYRYDDAGRMTGWTRYRGAQETRYDATGRRRTGADGATVPVTYAIERTAQGQPVVVEHPRDLR